MVQLPLALESASVQCSCDLDSHGRKDVSTSNRFMEARPVFEVHTCEDIDY